MRIFFLVCSYNMYDILIMLVITVLPNILGTSYIYLIDKKMKIKKLKKVNLHQPWLRTS